MLSLPAIDPNPSDKNLSPALRASNLHRDHLHIWNGCPDGGGGDSGRIEGGLKEDSGWKLWHLPGGFVVAEVAGGSVVDGGVVGVAGVADAVVDADGGDVILEADGRAEMRPGFAQFPILLLLPEASRRRSARKRGRK